MAGRQKEHGMSEEAPAIIGIAALAIDCTNPSGLAHWWRRVLGGTVDRQQIPVGVRQPDHDHLLARVDPEVEVGQSALQRLDVHGPAGGAFQLPQHLVET